MKRSLWLWAIFLIVAWANLLKHINVCKCQRATFVPNLLTFQRTILWLSLHHSDKRKERIPRGSAVTWDESGDANRACTLSRVILLRHFIRRQIKTLKTKWQAALQVCHHWLATAWAHGLERQVGGSNGSRQAGSLKLWWHCLFTKCVSVSQGVALTTAAEATVDVWRATACRAPRGESASQQSDGRFGVGRAQGLGFLLRCQENDLLGHGCRLPPWHSPIPNWYSSILMPYACLIPTAASAFISSSSSAPFQTPSDGSKQLDTY